MSWPPAVSGLPTVAVPSDGRVVQVTPVSVHEVSASRMM